MSRDRLRNNNAFIPRSMLVFVQWVKKLSVFFWRTVSLPCSQYLANESGFEPTDQFTSSPYLLTPWCTVLLEKLTGLQLVKKFSAFHGTRRFVTTLKRPPPVSIPGQPNPVHLLTSHLLEIHPNIIHPSTPRSPQWFLPSGFLTKTLYTPSPHPYAPHAQPISFFSILSLA